MKLTPLELKFNQLRVEIDILINKILSKKVNPQQNYSLIKAMQECIEISKDACNKGDMRLSKHAISKVSTTLKILREKDIIKSQDKSWDIIDGLEQRIYDAFASKPQSSSELETPLNKVITAQLESASAKNEDTVNDEKLLNIVNQPSNRRLDNDDSFDELKKYLVDFFTKHMINAEKSRQEIKEEDSERHKLIMAVLEKQDENMSNTMEALQQSLQKHSKETRESLNYLKITFTETFQDFLTELNGVKGVIKIQASIINGLTAAVEKMSDKNAKVIVESLTPKLENIIAHLASMNTSMEMNTAIIKGLAEAIEKQPTTIQNAIIDAFSKNKLIVWSLNEFEEAKAQSQNKGSWNSIPYLNFKDGKNRTNVIEFIKKLCGYIENKQIGMFHYVAGEGTEEEPMQYIVGISDSNKSIIGFPLELEILDDKLLVSFDFEKGTHEEPNYRFIQEQLVGKLSYGGLVKIDK